MKRFVWTLLLLCIAGTLQAQESGRVVVTGHAVDGTSIVSGDGPAPRVLRFSNSELRLIQVWGTDGSEGHAAAGQPPVPSVDTFLPPPGGSRFVLVELPTAAEDAASLADRNAFEAFQRDYIARVPNLAAAHADPANPPMHRTATVDYVIVLKGDVELELDRGRRVRIAPGDIIIQYGTNHALHNVGRERAILAAVMIGVAR